MDNEFEAGFCVGIVVAVIVFAIIIAGPVRIGINRSWERELVSKGAARWGSTLDGSPLLVYEINNE